MTKPETTIEEFIGDSAKFDDCGQYIWGLKDDKLQMIGEVRGWGAIQNLFQTQEEAEVFQDSLGRYIAEAITEKLQRARWTAYRWENESTRPPEPGRYLIYRAGCDKMHFEKWNGSGWSSSNNDCTHWCLPKKPE